MRPNLKLPLTVISGSYNDYELIRSHLNTAPYSTHNQGEYKMMKKIKAKDIKVGMTLCNGDTTERVTKLFKPASFGKSGIVTTHCDGYIEDDFRELNIREN